MLESILKEKKMTIYQCAKLSGIPYTTLSEVVRGKTKLEKCSAETVYRLSKVLEIEMEDLIEAVIEIRPDFEVFKSNVRHFIKDNEDLEFIITTLQEDKISRYWERKWYPEALYLLAMLDYLSRINEIPLCTKYNDIRSHSLKEPLYPRDVLLIKKLNAESDITERCMQDAIPEFLRFNIIEREVRNVC